jgi:hypothetical protein
MQQTSSIYIKYGTCNSKKTWLLGFAKEEMIIASQIVKVMPLFLPTLKQTILFLSLST